MNCEHSGHCGEVENRFHQFSVIAAQGQSMLRFLKMFDEVCGILHVIDDYDVRPATFDGTLPLRENSRHVAILR